MKFQTLLRRSLLYYWRTAGASALGAAVAVAVLAGGLLVGYSVRATLQELVFERLYIDIGVKLPFHRSHSVGYPPEQLSRRLDDVAFLVP